MVTRGSGRTPGTWSLFNPACCFCGAAGPRIDGERISTMPVEHPGVEDEFGLKAVRAAGPVESGKVGEGFGLSLFKGTIPEGEEDEPVLVRVQTPEGTVRQPSDICCVIDVSWSMSAEAKVHGDVQESTALTLLDVAKHAIRTIIATLDANDRLSVVEFCQAAKCVLALTPMDEEGKQLATERVSAITFGSGTAFLEGFAIGLQTLADKADPERFQHMLLLTDGVSEDGGEVMPHLRSLVDDEVELPSISTFGFGYNIDSTLLVEVSTFANGCYAFIADAGFVGTVFVNAISNLLVVSGRDAVLKLWTDSDASIQRVAGNWSAQKDGAGNHVINLGLLGYGQTRDIVIYVTRKACLFAKLEFVTRRDRFTLEAAGKPHYNDVVEIERCRCLFVDTLADAAKEAAPATEEALRKAQELVGSVREKVMKSTAASTEQVAALLEDIAGQATEAFSRMDWYQRWGIHYILSSMFAHKLQICSNFKDPGVQVYGGKMFRDLRDVADDLFGEMPAPIPVPTQFWCVNMRMEPNPHFRKHGGAPPTRIAMKTFHNPSTMCIAGESPVQLASGRWCQVSQLEKGDVVRTSSSDGRRGAARVACVVRTPCVDGRAVLVTVRDDVRLTPYHPVLLDGSWRWPVEVAEAEQTQCEALYSFVLHDGASALLVGDVPCIALGHSLTEGAAHHPYFGSPRVLEDLSLLPGYEAGVVSLAPEFIIRDVTTGDVTALRSPVL